MARTRAVRAHPCDTVVRAAVAADASAIASLHIAAWLATYRGLMPDDLLDGIRVEEWAAHRLTLLQDEAGPAGHRRTYVIETDGEVCGFTAVGIARDREEDSVRVGELMGLYLHPSWVGRGFGRRLWERGRQDLVEHGHREVVVWVLAGNLGARSFYERMGFVEDGAAAKEFRGHELPHLRYRQTL